MARKSARSGPRPEFISLGKVARAIGVTPTTLAKMADRREFPKLHRFGSHRYVRECEFASWMAAKAA